MGAPRVHWVLAMVVATMWVAGARGTPVPGVNMRVIGHRGGMGHWVPEHSILAYTLGAQLGADFLEPDVVSTKDGVLVCRHDILLDETTDVAEHPEFASLRTTKEIQFPYPNNVTGWFVEDFTWAQVQTLYAISRVLGGRGPLDRTYRVVSLRTMLQLTANLSAFAGRPIGVYPETKRPGHFESIGLPLEGKLLAQLAEAGFLERPTAAPPAPGELPWYPSPSPGGVVLQSFQPSSLRLLGKMTNAPRVQLIYNTRKIRHAASLGMPVPEPSPEGLRAISAYATGVGVPRSQLHGDAKLSPPVVATAHAAGLTVDVYTMNRNATRYEELAALNPDGLFTNDVGVATTVVSMLPQLAALAAAAGGEPPPRHPGQGGAACPFAIPTILIAAGVSVWAAVATVLFVRLRCPRRSGAGGAGGKGVWCCSRCCGRGAGLSPAAAGWGLLGKPDGAPHASSSAGGGNREGHGFPLQVLSGGGPPPGQLAGAAAASAK